MGLELISWGSKEVVIQSRGFRCLQRDFCAPAVTKSKGLV